MHFMYYLLFGCTLLLISCTADIGDSCGTGPFDPNCVTDNCVDNLCMKSDLGGACQYDTHCNQGYCILDTCRPISNIGELCEADYHCSKGVCKEYYCSLGEKGDACNSDEDCSLNFECLENSCVSSSVPCKIARFFHLDDIGAGWGILLIVIGVLSTIPGIAIPGLSIRLFGTNLVLSITALGAGILIIAVTIGGTCF